MHRGQRTAKVPRSAGRTVKPKLGRKGDGSLGPKPAVRRAEKAARPTLSAYVSGRTGSAAHSDSSVVASLREDTGDGAQLYSADPMTTSNPPPWAVSISLPCGGVAWVDPDIAWLYGWMKWHHRISGRKYVSTTINGKNLYLHRIVMGAVPGQIVHHRDGDPSHCWRANLQFVTSAENARMRRASRTRRKTSKYLGVSLSKQRSKWHASVTADGTLYSAGFYDDEVAAARARDALAVKKHGPAATLNFTR